MGRYLTSTPGIGGRLRVAPEDFVVEEIPLTFVPSRGPGKYTVAAIRARNWETNRLMQELGDRLGIGRNGLFFTGTKDKRAVTTQYVSIRAPEGDVRALQVRDVEILQTFRVDRAPKIGELLGNRFEIVVREVGSSETAAREARETVEAVARSGGFPNYFGIQRFGVVRPITQEVGKLLVRGELRSAFWLYAANPLPGEQADARQARERLQEAFERAGGDPAREIAAAKAGLSELPSFMSFERALLSGLVETDGDYRRAFGFLPKNLVTMFVYAYESLLFNRMISARLEEGLPLAEPQIGDVVMAATDEGTPDREVLVPVSERNVAKCKARVAEGKAFVTAVLAGPAALFAEGIQGRIEREVLAEEGMTEDDFVVRRMPEAGARGSRREIHLSPDPVELGTAGPNAIRLRFFLPKGAYATSFLREVMKAPPANMA